MYIDFSVTHITANFSDKTITVHTNFIVDKTTVNFNTVKFFITINGENKLLTDYNGKLEEIFKIVKENLNKHILIINASSEFARKVTEYINNMSDYNCCGDYHDRLEPIPASDLNGNPIYIKSGPNKGERKLYS